MINGDDDNNGQDSGSTPSWQSNEGNGEGGAPSQPYSPEPPAYQPPAYEPPAPEPVSEKPAPVPGPKSPPRPKKDRPVG